MMGHSRLRGNVMVSVVKMYKCNDVSVELGTTNLVTISDISGDELVVYKKDLQSLCEILSQLVKDGVIEGVSTGC